MVEQILNWDKQLFVLINQILTYSFFDWLMPWITDLHKAPWFLWTFAVPLLAVFYFFEPKENKQKLMVLIFLLALNDAVCGQLIKKNFARERPFTVVDGTLQKAPASGFSFVSNHAANTTLLAVFFSHFVREGRFLFYGFAFLVAYSRVYNGVHYPSDVVVGSFIGFLFAYVGINTLKKTKKEQIK